MPLKTSRLLPNGCFVHLGSDDLQKVQGIIETRRRETLWLRCIPFLLPIVGQSAASSDRTGTSRFGSRLRGLLSTGLGCGLDLWYSSFFFSKYSSVLCLALKFRFALSFLLLFLGLAALYIVVFPSIRFLTFLGDDEVRSAG